MNMSGNGKRDKRRIYANLLLFVIVILLAVIPLFINKNAEFGGADTQAEAAITEINQNYAPWFSSFWEPPSGEIESLLFALQAAVGSAVLFFGFGYLKGRSGRIKDK
jgi:cobalt/nickel transport protein